MLGGGFVVRSPGSDEAEIIERVMDQGLDIVVLCRFGDRRKPVSAHLMAFNHSGVAEDIAQVPIPVCVRGDVKFPRVWPDRATFDYGRN